MEERRPGALLTGQLELGSWDPVSAASRMQANSLSDKERQNLEEELSDCLLYLVRLADVTGVDLPSAVIDGGGPTIPIKPAPDMCVPVQVRRKMEANARKYPAELVRGSSKKYYEYQEAHREAAARGPN